RPGAGGEVHDVGDLAAVHLAEAAAEHREVLTEDVHGAAVDGAVPGDDAFAGRLHAVHQVASAMLDEHAELHEAALVEERRDAFARRQLACLVLFPDPLRTAALSHDLAALLHLGG